MSWGSSKRGSGHRASGPALTPPALGSGPRCWLCVLRGHFCSEESATLWLRPSRDLNFLSKAGLAGVGCLKGPFLPLPTPPAPPVCYPLLCCCGPGPGCTARRASHACAKQSALRVSPSLNPERVSLCMRTHGWHFCWKERHTCQFIPVENCYYILIKRCL